MDVTPEDALDPEALIEEPAVAQVSPEERSAEEAAARRLAERYRLDFLDMHEFRIDQELFRSIPADLMLRYGFVPYRRDGKALVIVVSDPDRPADDRRAVGDPRHARARDGRRALGHRGHAEEERKLAARARRGHRGIPDPGPQGGRGRRGQPHRRAPHERQQPDHPPGRLDHLHGDPAARQRHPHRDAGRCGVREVPHRRRAAAGDAADRQAVPQLDPVAHQGDGGARHRREARAAGRPLPPARARQDHRLPRLGDAERARRRRGHPYSRQAVDERAVHRAAPRHPRVSRSRS